MEPARGRLAVGALAQGRRGSDLPALGDDPAALRPLDPGQPGKLEAADALARVAEEAGISLIDMALAFVIRHPAVTAAIIGPRTIEQLESQLGATDVSSTPRCSIASTRSWRRGGP